MPASRGLAVLSVVLVLAVAGVGVALAVDRSHDEPRPEPATAGPTTGRPTASSPATPSGDGVDHVVAISVDGLNPTAIRRLGRAGTPALHRLMAEGASTLQARTAYEVTKTLPNHTGMLTGRPAARTSGGHGVLFNDDDDRTTVAKAAGGYVASVFDVVHDHGRSTSLYTSKEKFALFDRSWDAEHGAPDRVGADDGRDKIDRFVVRTSESALTRRVVADLGRRPSDFSFVHLAAPDKTGHAAGYMSRAYLEAVRATDAQVGAVVEAVRTSPRLRGRTAIVLTADHGGLGRDHSDASARVNFTIPFLVWGPDVAAGDLYALNEPAYAKPAADARPSYAPGHQPIRNAAVANLALDLLDLPPVPGSRVDAAQNLRVSAP